MKLITALSISVVTAATAGTPHQVSTSGESQWAGNLSLGLSHSKLDGGAVGSDEEDKYGAAEFELQLGRDFGDYFFQADLFGEMTDVGHTNDSYRKGLGTAFHLMRPVNDITEFGIFCGGFTTIQDNDSGDDSIRTFIGVESKIDRSEADYYLQVGYLFGDGGKDDGGEDSITDATFLRIVAEKALTETLDLTAEVGYADGKMDSDDDANVTNFGVAIHRSISDSLTASLSADWIYYAQGGDDNQEISEYIIGIGLTYTFGGEPNNTNLGTPRFLRWSGVTGGQLE
jgi:hypothetical protein